MVAEPGATAVTTPVASTVAMVSSLEVQVTEGSVASEGATVAVRAAVPPTVRLAVAGVTVMPVTGTAAAVTVTSLVPVKPPSVVVAVMVAEPGATPVTTPVASTVAMVSSLEVQVTEGSVASEGATVAVKVAVSPTVSASVAGATVIPVTGTVATFTFPFVGVTVTTVKFASKADAA
jgi:hypothetical protein